MKKQTLTSAEFRAGHVDQVEHDLQARAVAWFRLAYPQLLLIGIPNAAKRTKAERGRMLKEGMVAGAPDAVLAYPSGEYHSLWIEFKTTQKHSRPTDTQLKIHAYLRAKGYAVIMPRTFEEFQKQVNEYLTNP